MHASQVILISFFTSVLTAGGTVFLAERLQIFHVEKAPEARVPNLQGLAETDARENLRAAGLTMMIGARRTSDTAESGAVLDQIPPPGQAVGPGTAVTVTVAEGLPKVPNVVRLTELEAKSALEQAGFTVEIGPRVPHTEIAKGSIVLQVPASGTSAKKATKVVLQASAGPELVAVPKVTGLNLASAKKQLTDAGLKLGNVSWVQDDDLFPGAIVRQTPAAAEKAPPGAEVTLTINRE
jgi:eukaryotic-like serine/threonine-protein kinase